MGSQVTDEASVLEKFDRLVEAGTVLYTPDLKKIHHTDGALKFEFLITSALKSKPLAVWGNAELDSEQEQQQHHRPPSSSSLSSLSSSQPKEPQNHADIELDAEGCISGGDISVSGFVIDVVNGTHVLMFNKFCVYRPHLILLTADGRRRQFEALDETDLASARDVLAGLHRRSQAAAAPPRERGPERGQGQGQGQGEFLAIFNCGRDGECSRLHKHMQIIPATPPSSDDDNSALWPDDEAQEREVPFRYFIKRFEDGKMPPAEELAGGYRRMLAEAARAVPGRAEVVEEDGDGRAIAVPHNLVLGPRWMVVVPRRRVGFGKADANAAGMLGRVWASGEETVQAWMELGPKWVLGEVGVRK